VGEGPERGAEDDDVRILKWRAPLVAAGAVDDGRLGTKRRRAGQGQDRCDRTGLQGHGGKYKHTRCMVLKSTTKSIESVPVPGLTITIPEPCPVVSPLSL